MPHLPLAILVLFLFSCTTQPKEKDRIIENTGADTRFPVDSAKFMIDKGPLIEKIETLDVSYAAIMCPCAQWFETKYAGDTSSDIDYFYLEPANSNVIDADTLFKGEYFPVRISVRGQFYEKEGYPKNYFVAKGDPKPAKVFRYDRIDIIKRGNSLSTRNGW